MNHIFDTPGGHLASRGIALRLREEAGCWTLTAKGPARVGPEVLALTTRPETEVEVGPELAAAILAERASPAEVLCERAPDAPLRGELERALEGRRPLCLGSFRNRRQRIGPVELPGELPGETPLLALLFELDRTQFPGGRVEREVEVELPPELAEAAERALRSLWSRAGLVWRSAPSKTARFRAALEATD